MANNVADQLRTILSPENILSVYYLQFPDIKGTTLTGSDGITQFEPNPTSTQTFYDTIYHPILIPLSTLPLASILALDLPALLLPDPQALDFPEQCLGLITILDQTRTLTGGTYNTRYTRCFFDPICEHLAKQLFFSLPEHQRPDGSQAWLSRGYTFSQWLTRVPMLWGPLVHSDTFMVQSRHDVKNFLHSVRSEIETHYSVRDPFAPLESADDVDLTLFPRMVAEDPPEKSFADPAQQLQIWEYGFWWIRILNAHFALTDYCGHYPYASEWHGRELTERDREFLEMTGDALYDVSLKPLFEMVKNDVREGVWRPMKGVESFEGR